jgi:hypothetical protein
MRFSVVLMLGAFAVCPGCVGAGETEDDASNGSAGPPAGTVTERASPGSQGAAAGEHTGTAASAWFALGPQPHGVVADDTALAGDAVSP